MSIAFPVTDDQLEEVAECSGVLDVEDNYLEPAFQMECQRLIPDVEAIEAKDCRNAYLYLKDNFAHETPS